MGPKKRALEAPTVSDEELEKAKSLLKDAEEAKRVRSSMVLWLEGQGSKKVYDGWPIGKRKEYFQSWFADKLKNGSGTSKATKTATLIKQNKNKVAWWSLTKMISEFGEQKAKEKVEVFDKDPTKWRPDRDTGHDGPLSREYSINLDSREEGDEERDTHELGTEVDLDTEEKQKESEETFGSMRACNAGSSSDGLIRVKKEAGDEPAEAKPEDSATFKALKTDGKKVVFNIGKALTIVKQMFIASKGGKFLGELNKEISNNVKEMTQIFITVEDAVLNDAEEATMLALTAKVDKAFEALNDSVEWFNKFSPKEGQQKKQKI